MAVNKREEHIYQKIFELTLEWGDQWEDRVKDRIKKLHPEITSEEIKKISDECGEIRKQSVELKKQKREISHKEFKQNLQARYPLLSDQNMRQLFYHAHPKIELQEEKAKKSQGRHLKTHSEDAKSVISKLFKRFF